MDPVVAIIAGVVGLGGLLLALAGLFVDRPRGRRRCAKCGYSMVGVAGLRCPECGRTAASERGLHRTRRHAWPVALGLVLMVLSAAGFGWSRWRAAGWEGVPGAVLVRLHAINDQDLHDEIARRVSGGLLSPGAAGELARRAASDLASDEPKRVWRATTLVDSFAFLLMQQTEPVPGDPTDEEREADARRAAIARALAPAAAATLMESPDAGRRARALRWCDAAAPYEIAGVHALLAAGSDASKGVTDQQVYPVRQLGFALRRVLPYEVRRHVSAPGLTSLSEIRGPLGAHVRTLPATEEAMRSLARELLADERSLAFLERRSSESLGLALMARLDGPSEELRAEVLRAARGEHGAYERLVGLRMLVMFPWSDAHASVAAEAITSESWEVRTAAWDLIARAGEAASGIEGAALEAIARPDVEVPRQAIETLLELGVEPAAIRERAVAALRARLAVWNIQREEPLRINGRRFIFGGGAIDWIRMVGEGDPAVIETLRRFVFETEPGLSARSAMSYARVSGDSAGAARAILDAYERTAADKTLAPGALATNRASAALRALAFARLITARELAVWAMEDGDAQRPQAVLASFVRRPMSEDDRAYLRAFAEALTDHPVEFIRERAEQTLANLDDGRR